MLTISIFLSNFCAEPQVRLELCQVPPILFTGSNPDGWCTLGGEAFVLYFQQSISTSLS
jgi:hypothetical protein